MHGPTCIFWADLTPFSLGSLRLDHAYGMAMSSAGAAGGEGLHLGGAMFEQGSYYVTHGARVHNGLLSRGPLCH